MSPLTVADCMIKPTVKLSGSMLVVEAARQLIENKSLGAPVIGDDHKLIGWISEVDCLDAVMQVAYYEQRVAMVSDVMRTEVLSVEPGDSALDLVAQMKGAKPKLYPVVEDGKLIGIISRRLILSALCDLIGKKNS